MLHLIKLEWLKVKNYRTFWIIFILYLIGIIGANYITHEIQGMIWGAEAKKNPSSAMLKFILGNPPYSFPQVWQMVAQTSSYLLIIPGLLTVILFTNEYSYKTHRQNLIDGLTRYEFISSKILTVIIISLISTLLVGVTALAFGYTGDKPLSFERLLFIGYSFIQSLNYCFFALLISVLFRRSGISIGVYFIYVVILEFVLFFVFKRYVYNTGYFLPVESADGLISAPLFERGQKEFFPKPEVKYILMTCIGYIALYLLIIYRKFKTDDL